MRKKLLLAGGIVNTIFGLFHIWLGTAIQHSDKLTMEARSLLHAFNVFGTVAIFYFAYMSFFHRRELLETKLGKTVMSLVVFVYFSRALEEFILFDFSIVIFASCILAGGIYLALLLAPTAKTQDEAFA